MSHEIPTAEQQSISAKKPMQRVEIRAGQGHCRNEKTPGKKKPKRERPGEILKCPIITEPEKDYVGHCDRGTNLLRSVSISTQPGYGKHCRDCDKPATLEDEHRYSKQFLRPDLNGR